MRGRQRDEKALSWEDKRKQGRRGETKQPDGRIWKHIFALSSRARSYYWHTWCNILPLIFASVRGFLLWPWRDFTLLGMRQAVHCHDSKRRRGRGKQGNDRGRWWSNVTKVCEEWGWYIYPLIPHLAHPFDSSRVEVALAREKFAAKVEGCPTRDRTAGIVVSSASGFSLHVFHITSAIRISSIHVLQ